MKWNEYLSSYSMSGNRKTLGEPPAPQPKKERKEERLRRRKSNSSNDSDNASVAWLELARKSCHSCLKVRLKDEIYCQTDPSLDYNWSTYQFFFFFF